MSTSLAPSAELATNPPQFQPIQFNGFRNESERLQNAIRQLQRLSANFALRRLGGADEEPAA